MVVPEGQELFLLDEDTTGQYEPTRATLKRTDVKCRQARVSTDVNLTLCRVKGRLFNRRYHDTNNLFIRATVPGAFDRTLGKGYYSLAEDEEGELFLWERGLLALNTDVEAKISNAAARFACSAGARRFSRGSSTYSPWWATQSYAGNVVHRSSADIIPNPCELFPKKQRKPKPAIEVEEDEFDHDYTMMTPKQRMAARCTPFVAHRGKLFSVCRLRKPTRFSSWTGFDITVIPRNVRPGQKVKPLGRALYNTTDRMVWLEDMKAVDADTELDLDLLSARLACGMGKGLAGPRGKAEEVSYFWRSKITEGRAKRFAGRFKIDENEVCRGVPLYTNKGVIERVKRRPKIY